MKGAAVCRELSACSHLVCYPLHAMFIASWLAMKIERSSWQ